MNMIRKIFLALTKAMYKHQFSWYLNFWNCKKTGIDENACP